MTKLERLAREPWLIVTVITLAALSMVGFRNFIYPYPGREVPMMVAESQQYMQMAQGDSHEVIAPFTKRFLYPFLVRCLYLSTGLPFKSGFIFMDIASFVLLAYCLVKIIEGFGLSPWVTGVFLLTPFTVERLELGYLVDLFHAALTALFFLLILRERFLWGLVVLALSFMTRENTLVMCLILGVLAWRRNLRGLALGSGVVTVFGMAFGAWCARSGQPNVHGLPDFVYLALKMPHQFLKNVLGFRIWTNTLPYGDVFKKLTLPHFLQWGDVREVGICHLEPDLPLFTLITLLSLFGSGPLVIWVYRRVKPWTKDHPLMVQLAVVYGLIAFFLGTSLGDWLERLIGYGWPLFWIGVPYVLAARQMEIGVAKMRCILLSLFVVAWIPSVMDYSRLSSIPGALVTLAVVVIAYGFTIWRLGGVKLAFRSDRGAPNELGEGD